MSKISKLNLPRKGISLMSAVALFMVVFTLLAGAAYAATGFLEVFATDNTIEIVDDGTTPSPTPTGDFNVTISKNRYSDFSESISNVIDVKINSKTTTYTYAGYLYLKNETAEVGTVVPSVVFDTESTGTEDIMLKVTRGGGTVTYEGKLSDYGTATDATIVGKTPGVVGSNGEISLGKNEVEKLNFYVKYSPYLETSAPVTLKSINFDLAYKVK